MPRSKNVSFDVFYAELLNYYNMHGNCKMSRNYKSNGYNLGLIVYNTQHGRRVLTEEQRQKLEAIGFKWSKRGKRTVNIPFEEYYPLFLKYYKKYNNLDIPEYYTSEKGIKLGSILKKIKNKQIRLSLKEKKILYKEFGVSIWERHYLTFEEKIQLLLEYKEAYGNLTIQRKYVTEEGIKLGSIALKFRMHKKNLSESEKEKLLEIGFFKKK